MRSAASRQGARHAPPMIRSEVEAAVAKILGRKRGERGTAMGDTDEEGFPLHCGERTAERVLRTADT